MFPVRKFVFYNIKYVKVNISVQKKLHYKITLYMVYL